MREERKKDKEQIHVYMWKRREKRRGRDKKRVEEGYEDGFCVYMWKSSERRGRGKAVDERKRGREKDFVCEVERREEEEAEQWMRGRRAGREIVCVCSREERRGRGEEWMSGRGRWRACGTRRSDSPSSLLQPRRANKWCSLEIYLSLLQSSKEGRKGKAEGTGRERWMSLKLLHTDGRERRNQEG